MNEQNENPPVAVMSPEGAAEVIAYWRRIANDSQRLLAEARQQLEIMSANNRDALRVELDAVRGQRDDAIQAFGNAARGLHSLLAFLKTSGKPVGGEDNKNVWTLNLTFSGDVPLAVELARMIRAMANDQNFKHNYESIANESQPTGSNRGREGATEDSITG